MRIIFSLLIIPFLICCKISYAASAPERSWEFPDTIKQIRKQPIDLPGRDIVEIIKLIDHAIMLAAQDRDGVDTKRNYACYKWKKAVLLLDRAIALYEKSSNNSMTMLRLASYAMNKRSMMIAGIDLNFSPEETVKKQSEALKQLINEFGSRNDPEIERNIFEARVDLAINEILGWNHTNEDARKLLAELESTASRLNDDRCQYHLGRFLVTYSQLIAGEDEAYREELERYMEKNKSSGHTGVNRCIAKIRFLQYRDGFIPPEQLEWYYGTFRRSEYPGGLHILHGKSILGQWQGIGKRIGRTLWQLPFSGSPNSPLECIL